MYASLSANSSGEPKVGQCHGRNSPHQPLFSHSSAGWEVQDQSTRRFGVWQSPVSWFIVGCLLTVSLQSRKSEREPSGDCYINALYHVEDVLYYS